MIVDFNMATWGSCHFKYMLFFFSCIDDVQDHFQKLFFSISKSDETDTFLSVTRNLILGDFRLF